MSGPNVGSLSVNLIDDNYYPTLMWQLTGTQTNSSEWKEGRLPIPPTDKSTMVCRLLGLVSGVKANHGFVLQILREKDKM